MTALTPNTVLKLKPHLRAIKRDRQTMTISALAKKYGVNKRYMSAFIKENKIPSKYFRKSTVVDNLEVHLKDIQRECRKMSLNALAAKYRVSHYAMYTFASRHGLEHKEVIEERPWAPQWVLDALKNGYRRARTGGYIVDKGRNSYIHISEVSADGAKELSKSGNAHVSLPKR